MATTPRPALDAWLATADRVLADTRIASLSPSLVPGPWDSHRTEQATTLAEFEVHPEELLTRLAFGPANCLTASVTSAWSTPSVTSIT